MLVLQGDKVSSAARWEPREGNFHQNFFIPRYTIWRTKAWTVKTFTVWSIVSLMDARPNIRDDSAHTFLIIIHRLIQSLRRQSFRNRASLRRTWKAVQIHTRHMREHSVRSHTGVKVSNDVSLLSRFIEITYMQQTFLALFR